MVFCDNSLIFEFSILFVYFIVYIIVFSVVKTQRILILLTAGVPFCIIFSLSLMSSYNSYFIPIVIIKISVILLFFLKLFSFLCFLEFHIYICVDVFLYMYTHSFVYVYVWVSISIRSLVTFLSRCVFFICFLNLPMKCFLHITY